MRSFGSQFKQGKQGKVFFNPDVSEKAYGHIFFFFLNILKIVLVVDLTLKFEFLA